MRQFYYYFMFTTASSLADDYYYTLRDVLFFMENSEIGVADYRRMCVEMKITAVVEQDKQSMKSYLLGEISSCNQLDLSVAATSAVIPAAARTVDDSATHRISASEMQEQRSRHAAFIDQSLQKTVSTRYFLFFYVCYVLPILIF
jgi:hypothetical protein